MYRYLSEEPSVRSRGVESSESSAAERRRRQQQRLQLERIKKEIQIRAEISDDVDFDIEEEEEEEEDDDDEEDDSDVKIASSGSGGGVAPGSRTQDEIDERLSLGELNLREAGGGAKANKPKPFIPPAQQQSQPVLWSVLTPSSSFCGGENRNSVLDDNGNGFSPLADLFSSSPLPPPPSAAPPASIVVSAAPPSQVQPLSTSSQQGFLPSPPPSLSPSASSPSEAAVAGPSPPQHPPLTPPSSPESPVGLVGNGNATTGLVRLSAPNGFGSALVRMTAAAPGGSVPKFISLPSAPSSSPSLSSPAATSTPSAAAASNKGRPGSKRPSSVSGDSADNPSGENKKRIHRCNFPDCRKVYTKSSHLKAHQRTHTGSR